MIYFETVKWKNLLSTGDIWTELSLSTDNLTLINGENGAGKTTLLDAIAFALYNKPYRNINKPQLINSINKKDLTVELTFRIGKNQYKIVRGIKPNVFEIWKNDQLLNQDAAARDYQEYLETQILKLNYKSFCQVVILGSTSFVPFMQLKSQDRRQIIEDLLELEIFTTMNTLLKDKTATNTSALRDNDYQYEMTSEKLSITEEHQQAMEKDIDVEIQKRKAEVQSYQSRIEQEKATISENQKRKEEILGDCPDPKKVKMRLEKIQHLQHQLNNKIKNIDSAINFFNEHDNCPTCKQDIDQTFKQQTIDEKTQSFDETKQAAEQLREQYENAQQLFQQVEQSNALISEINIEDSARNSTIIGLEQQIKKVSQEVLDLVEKKKSVATDNTTIKELEKHLAILAKEKKRLLEKKEIMSVTSILLKDSGIKSRIIKQYIPIINKLINKYLAAMDFFVQFELDETFSETIKSRHRDKFSYDSFSEGEKTRINLAILFAWRAIAKLRNSASTNLLVFDEVLDSSTDQVGIEAFFNIIREVAADSNVIVISHTQEQYESKFDKIVKFKKVKNFSRMVA